MSDELVSIDIDPIETQEWVEGRRHGSARTKILPVFKLQKATQLSERAVI